MGLQMLFHLGHGLGIAERNDEHTNTKMTNAVLMDAAMAAGFPADGAIAAVLQAYHERNEAERAAPRVEAPGGRDGGQAPHAGHQRPDRAAAQPACASFICARRSCRVLIASATMNSMASSSTTVGAGALSRKNAT